MSAVVLLTLTLSPQAGRGRSALRGLGICLEGFACFPRPIYGERVIAQRSGEGWVDRAGEMP
jgi:hypothetical protein